MGMNCLRFSTAQCLIPALALVACNGSGESHRLGGANVTGGVAASSSSEGGAAGSGPGLADAGLGSGELGGKNAVGTGGASAVGTGGASGVGTGGASGVGTGGASGVGTGGASGVGTGGASGVGTGGASGVGVCGNAVLEVGESCDAGGQNGFFFGDGTGCSRTCTKEPVCRVNGVTGACSTACGDGNNDLGEACDDGNQLNGDGCSATCVLESGFSCTDTVIEDTVPCSSNPALQCLVLAVTYRDFDGQQVAGAHPDFFYLGASAAPGRTTGVVPGASQTTCVPNASGTKAAYVAGQVCPNSDATGPCVGLVKSTLGSDGKPVFASGTCPCIFTDWDRTGILGSCPTSGNASCTPSPALTGITDCAAERDGSHRLRVEATVTVIQSQDSFALWYADSALSTTSRNMLELAATGTGQYQFSSSAGRTIYDDIHDACLASDHSGTLRAGFFPLEASQRTKLCNIWPYWVSGLSTNCCAGTGCPVLSQWDPQAAYDGCPATGTGGPVPSSSGTGGRINGTMRNFYFTTEIRYLYRYDGTAASLSYYGNDDAWIFINGRLAFDLGAPHERVQVTATLNGSLSGLKVGSTYEIAIFHANRNPKESNFQLTLPASKNTRSVCTRF